MDVFEGKIRDIKDHFERSWWQSCQHNTTKIWYYISYTNPPAEISPEHTRKNISILHKTHQNAYENSKNHNSCRETWCFDLGMCSIDAQLKKRKIARVNSLQRANHPLEGYKEMSKDWVSECLTNTF